jgi:hypothetical protein
MSTLITVERLKSLLGVADGLYDAPIQFALEVASQLIQDYTGRRLVYGRYTEIFRGPCYTLDLGEFPVAQVESFTPAIGFGHTLFRDTGIVKMNGSLGGFNEVSVTYTAGYEQMPADIVAVLLDLSKRQLMSMGVELPSMGDLRPQTKGVTVGTLKVDYAVSATVNQQSAGSAVSGPALKQYAGVLDMYVHPRRLVATP